jgi:hypothetical protein
MFSLFFKYNLCSIILLAGVITTSAHPFRSPTKTEVVRWAVQKTSTLRIKGKTNITDFTCDIKGYYQQDTICYSMQDDRNKVVNLKGQLSINVNNFDCHNKMLTKDLRKTLRADLYPNMVVRFIGFQRMPAFVNNKDVIRGWVEVELSGTCKRFEICYKLEKTGSVINLNGVKSFSFSDFNLVPPQKLGGIVKVKEDFSVDFNLVLNQLI